MKLLSTLTLSVALTLSAAAGTPAYATEQATDSSQAGAASAMSEGEIRKIDKGLGKITIKHGELKNLAMPPMTMIFRVKDPVMLDQVKVGDNISFVAEQIDGRFAVTRIEARK